MIQFQPEKYSNQISRFLMKLLKWINQIFTQHSKLLKEKKVFPIGD